MTESKYLFERVKKTATKAITAERNGELKIAFEMFLQAAELLNQLIASERSPKVRDSYYVKAKEYITRAKEIKILMDGPKEIISNINNDLPDVSSKTLPPPPRDRPKTTPPPPPPPKDKPKTTLPPPPKEKRTPPPPPPENLTKKMMRGEDEDEITKIPPPKPEPKTKPKETPPPPPQKKVELPSKTTFELLYDEGKYRECFIECGKSVEAELRVRMGLFDEQLTLGMLIDRATKKGFEVLRDFKFVNIILNRIEHENYRPKQQEALRAINITNKILMS